MAELPGSSLSRAVRQQLESWQRAGLTYLPRSAVASEPDRVDSVVSTIAEPPAKSTPIVEAEAAEAAPVAAASSARRLSRDERIQRLDVLNQNVKQCRRCPELAGTRTQTVFGVGNPEARIVFIGEAPGADEDAQGEPFVGRAGQLLNKIIEACKLQRGDVFICNILKCRPPGNRTPAPDECSNCREYLLGQLSTIDPDYIVCWGSVAAQNLLGLDWSIGKMRKRWYQFGRAKVVCTYHPSYLLRNPAAKKDVWDDMKFLFATMGVTLTP